MLLLKTPNKLITKPIIVTVNIIDIKLPSADPMAHPDIAYCPLPFKNILCPSFTAGKDDVSPGTPHIVAITLPIY